ncbi:MAG: hypothetical protein JSW25_04365, partial [Thermoplasmata archaeon]
MSSDDNDQRRFPLAYLLVALVLALPLSLVMFRGVAMVLTTLGIVMAFDPAAFVLFGILLLPRILGSLWVYFRVDNLWGNEVGYMAIFLLLPLIGLVIYLANLSSLKQPPRGFEYATIKDGLVHQPLYEYIGPP